MWKCFFLLQNMKNYRSVIFYIYCIRNWVHLFIFKKETNVEMLFSKHKRISQNLGSIWEYYLMATLPIDMVNKITPERHNAENTHFPPAKCWNNSKLVWILLLLGYFQWLKKLVISNIIICPVRPSIIRISLDFFVINIWRFTQLPMIW